MNDPASAPSQPSEVAEPDVYECLAARPAPGRLLAPDEAEFDPDGDPDGDPDTGPDGDPDTDPDTGPDTRPDGDPDSDAGPAPASATHPPWPTPATRPSEGTWAAKLTGPTGHSVYARLASAAPGVSPAGRIRLGRSLWSELRAKPGDALAVTPQVLDVCEHVTVQSDLALSDTLRQRAIDNLRRSTAAVWSEAVFSFPLLGEGSEVSLVVTACRADPGVIGSQTRIQIVEGSPRDHGHSHGGDTISHRPPVPATRGDFGGSVETVQRLMDLLGTSLNDSGLFTALGVRPPRGVLLHGPPGTGKTLLARVVASEIGAHVMALSSSELVGTFSGETESNLRKLFQRAAEHAPTLILLDEVDVLTTKRDRLASMADVRGASQLLALLDGVGALGRVMVLGTTNRLAAIDEAFRRPGRFDVELAVLPPDEDGRRDILAVHTRDMPLTAGAEEALDRFAASGSAGMTGADLMSFAREVALHAARRLSTTGHARGAPSPVGSPAPLRSPAPSRALVAIEAGDVVAAARVVRPSLLRGLRVSSEGDGSAWEKILGLEAEKADLQAAAAEALAPGAQRGHGVLITGAPGTGKSMLLRALAGRVGATYVEVDGTAVFTQWLGESEAELRAAFARAREVRPVVVGLEHLEVLAPRRGAHVAGEATRAGDRVLGALLSELDDTLGQGRAMVVGVTDRPDLVDPAVLRAGRLGLHVEIQELPEVTRRAMIESVLGAQETAAQASALVAETAGLPAAAVLGAAQRFAGRLRRA